MIKHIDVFIQNCLQCPYYRHHYCNITKSTIEKLPFNDDCPLEEVE